MPVVVSRSRSIFSSSSSSSSSFSLSLSSKIHRSAAGAVGSRSYSQDHSYNYWSSNDAWASVAVSATAGALLLGGISSSQTLCESSTSGMKTDITETETSSQTNNNPGEYILEDEPEIDPYDNLPEKDEPTHCSICLTYRQGPCRPYWRKVEACTKDGEKDRKKEDEEKDDNSKDGSDDSQSPMSESTRCFKYMMPWIDCASKYRNLYTLIEMDTNYTEGILELEATSRHLCWVPGKEPKIDWSNWEQSGTEEEEEEEKVDPKITKKPDDDADADNDDNASTDLISNVALWKTLDTALGDPKLITVEATVPATINSGLGILECAYAVDQDNNVIGFAYGTKPSDLLDDDKDNKKADDGDDDTSKTIESSNDDEKEKKGAENDTTVEENANEEKMMVALSIRLLASRTENFTLAASYTHRIEGAKSSSTSNESEKKNSVALESHLYKSKPFVLADIPKLPTPLAPVQESSDSTNAGAASPQVSS